MTAVNILCSPLSGDQFTVHMVCEVYEVMVACQNKHLYFLMVLSVWGDHK